MSEQHPDVVNELRALLNRYRDSGYSREPPPAGVKPADAKVVSLAPLTGTVVMSEPLTTLPGTPWTASRGEWQAKDGGLWGMVKGVVTRAENFYSPAGRTRRPTMTILVVRK